MSALRTSANQQASPSFWSLRPADDLWVAVARERASEPLRVHCENIIRYYAERFRIFHIMIFLLVFLFIEY